MTEWRWLAESTVLAIHDEQLVLNGGGAGIRDIGLLRSARARPINLASYGEPGVFDLAAAYAFGIVRNHPFVDGNKRSALIAAATFLLDNGHELNASEADAVITRYNLPKAR